MQPLKIVVIGPVRSGKTMIANFLADATEIPYDYHPTQGVRILEFEVQNINVNSKNITKDIELWDCSGDHKYSTIFFFNILFCLQCFIPNAEYTIQKHFRFENCWPSIKKHLHGVILVYSEKSDECLKQIQEFYDYFVNQTKLGPDKCVILCYDPEKKNPEISKMICF
ncbi:intraflagellar transport protein 22 homolog isoform X3 [Halictus rubicundus]|uniref:intraflagellar transport protein 22 homolog isoform X3 n=1 Tax=Halictus rubicundus TaxID=77578 RepID=UPI0040371FDB